MKTEIVSNFLNSIINQKKRVERRNQKIQKKIKEKFFPLDRKFYNKKKSLSKLSLHKKPLSFFKKKRVLYQNDKIRISFSIL